MKILWLSVLLIGSSLLNGQTDLVFDVQGVLKLLDRPLGGTPVEALSLRIHPLGRGFDIDAQADREGRFTLEKVRPGRYSLTFPMPGRIESFTYGSQELSPEGFELGWDGRGSLVLVISMKSSEVSVKVQGIPSGHGDVVALLVPGDTHLTLRESCYLNPLSGPQTKFGYVPPGKYRVIIVDAEFQRDVAAYAPRFPDFLKNEATLVEAPGTGRTEATGTYVDGETIKEALRRAGPLNPIRPPM